MAAPHAYRVVLTGATGGIGSAMALELASHCESMLLLGRNTQALKDLVARIQARHPQVQVHFLAGNMTDAEYVQEVSRAANSLQANLLVNNAGVNSFGPVEGVSAPAQAEIIQINLLVPMVLTRLVLPVLKAQPSAQVLFVGSVFGYIGYPGNAAYCASKFGLRGYAQALRRECANSVVEVKYLAPRATQTAINQGAVEQLNHALHVHSDSPERVAQALMQLLAGTGFARTIGWPEKLFVWINRLLPCINDKAIRGQLATIQKYFKENQT